MNVVVNDLMTDYQKIGRGQKILVFLHGWGDTSKTFSKLVEQLKNDYTILALDLPGFGGTQAPPTAWGLSDYANFIKAWLEKTGVNNIYALVGHSYGGAVAIAGLSSGALKADKLILIASAGIRGKNKLRGPVLKTITKPAKLALFLLPKQTRKRLRAKFYSSIGSDIALLPHMEPTFKRIISEDIRTKAKRITVPTLLIYGTDDKETPPEDGRILNRAIAGSRLELIQGAGHFLHQGSANHVDRLVTEFLNA